MRYRRSLAALGMTVVVASSSVAQNADPVFARARQLVQSGNGAAGRLLIDSVLSATSSTLPVYGEALYWGATFAVSSADAERDYQRFVAEFPFSPHAADGLLQLSQLEAARGDRASASRHIEQFLTDFPKHAERPRATLLFVRMLMEQNELPRGCSALRQTLADLPSDAIEVRNQLEYYMPRCAANDVTRGGAVPVDSVSKDTVVTVRAPERFTLQIAAYKTKAEAEALAKRLKARKIDARIVAVSKLYRVRVGRYATRGAAEAARRELKAKKIDAFLTEIGPDDPAK